MTYNAEAVATSVTPPGGGAVNMSYTGLGDAQRVAATSTSYSNTYQYDATGNVLMPTLVKRHFPGQPGVLTGIYPTAISLVSSLGPGLTVLLAVHGGVMMVAGILAGADTQVT